MKHTRPKGTKDFLPPESLRKQNAEAEFRRIAQLYGFQEAVTPIIEHTELYVKTSGETSDVVTKEMYTFKDRGDRSITLRPEGTPGLTRALLESRLPLPCRLYYIGPMYRYNRPQKGRYREFYQLGVESYGEADPRVDAEVIALGYEYFRALGIEDCETHINTIGCRECRPAYHEKLKSFLRDLSTPSDQRSGGPLCPDCRIRAEQNPLRVFDCKDQNCQTLLVAAPRSKDNLCSACAQHFATVQTSLQLRKVPFVLNDRMVRGLDYYSRTTFEYTSRSLGAQNSLGGGGRYDYMIEDFGGPCAPAIGFALGEERTLLAATRPRSTGILPVHLRPLVFLVALSENERPSAVSLLSELRQAGIAAQMDYDSRKVKNQFRSADAAAARYSLILGENELTNGTVSIKDMKTGEQQEVRREDLITLVRSRLSALSDPSDSSDPSDLPGGYFGG
jgi:histidyl-tRNA synthetase